MDQLQAKPNYLIVIISSILGITLLASTIFLYFQNQQLKNLLVSQQVFPAIQAPSPTPIVSSILIPSDETASWSIYTNENAGISFKYPPQISEQSVMVSGPVLGNADFVGSFADKATVIQGTDAPFNGFSIYEIEQARLGISFDAYIAQEVEAVKKGERGIPTASAIKATINGQNFTYIDSESNIRRYFILSPLNNRIVIFSRVNSTPGFLATFDQILSTFKFTDQNNSICPDSYKLYENKVFSVCGPLSMTYTIEEYPAHDRPEVQAIKLVFEDDNQRINIMTAFTGGWGGGYTTEKTVLDQHQATKLISKDKNGNFSNLILVTDDQQVGQFPIAIDYQRKNEAFSLNEQLFQELIQSFKLK